MSELPEDIVDQAERLTRRARETADQETARESRAEREALLAEYGYAARVREEDDRAVLVCYPTEWLEDDTAQLDLIEDTERAIERSLSGPTDADWEVIAAHNEAIVEAVAEEHGEPHAANAQALAEYANNHVATTIDRLSEDDLDRFREDFFPRNTWPSDEQQAVLEESIAVTLKESESVSDAPPK